MYDLSRIAAKIGTECMSRSMASGPPCFPLYVTAYTWGWSIWSNFTDLSLLSAFLVVAINYFCYFKVLVWCGSIVGMESGHKLQLLLSFRGIWVPKDDRHAGDKNLNAFKNLVQGLNTCNSFARSSSKTACSCYLGLMFGVGQPLCESFSGECTRHECPSPWRCLGPQPAYF